MTAVVVVDGAVVAPEAAKVSVFDRGFLYGDSVYEVIRTYGGRPWALEEHLGRLERSAEMIGMRLPVSQDTLREEVHRGLEAAGEPEAYVRIVVTRGAGPIGLDPALAERPVRIVLVLPLVPQPVAQYADGVSVVLVEPGPRAGLLPVSESGTAKTGNYLPNVLAVRDARAKGGYEALLLDPSGRVWEGASSNVFIVRGGALRTPPLTAGILEGITRRHVIRIARARGRVVEEADVTRDDVVGAEEVFLTSTLREIVPVVRIDGRPVSDGRPGPVARELLDAFHEEVRR